LRFNWGFPFLVGYKNPYCDFVAFLPVPKENSDSPNVRIKKVFMLLSKIDGEFLRNKK